MKALQRPERDLSPAIRRAALQRFHDGPREVSMLFLGILIRALPDASRVQCRERFHLRIARIEVESATVRIRHPVRRIAAPGGRVIAAGVEQDDDLLNARLLDPVPDLRDTQRSRLQHADVVGHLGIRRQKEGVVIAFNAMTRKRKQQEAVFRNDPRKVREPEQYVPACRLTLRRLIRRKNNNLFFRKSRVLRKRFGERACVVRRRV